LSAQPPVGPVIRVVVVTHNSARHISACLGAVVSTAAVLELRIMDNASSDGTVAVIRRDFPDIPVEESARNLGFGRAVNGLCGGLAGTDYVLLVNPDAVLQTGAIDALAALAVRYPQAGLYGGRMLDAEGRMNPVSCLPAPSLWQAAAFGLGLSLVRGAPVLDPDSLGGWRRTGTREVPILTGGMLLIAAPLWTALGGFDEAFVLYGEDVDLCLRARALGARPMFTDCAVFLHDDGASASSRGDQQINILRGKASLYRRHLRGGAGGLACGFLVLGALLRAGLEIATGRQERPWGEAWRRRADWRGGWEGHHRL
jgi:N-acetylglucosaminyl-diphospho-decaprenol L-rhamnosyltransferase